jgi:hypothetical protein
LKKEVFLKITVPVYKAKVTRTAWAVFKYCGTKTVTLRMKQIYKNIDLKFISKETNKIRGKN